MRQVIALVGCLSLLLQGCTAMQAVPVPQGGSGTAAVQVGDTVAATTHAGEVKRFKVTAVTSEELRGTDDQVAYAEIYVTDTLWPDFRRRHLRREGHAPPRGRFRRLHPAPPQNRAT